MWYDLFNHHSVLVCVCVCGEVWVGFQTVYRDVI